MVGVSRCTVDLAFCVAEPTRKAYCTKCLAAGSAGVRVGACRVQELVFGGGFGWATALGGLMAQQRPESCWRHARPASCMSAIMHLRSSIIAISSNRKPRESLRPRGRKTRGYHASQLLTIPDTSLLPPPPPAAAWHPPLRHSRRRWRISPCGRPMQLGHSEDLVGWHWVLPAPCDIQPCFTSTLSGTCRLPTPVPRDYVAPHVRPA